MSYVIVNTVSRRLYKKSGHVCAMSYATQQGARTAATKLNTKSDSSDYIVMSQAQFEYYYPVKMVERVNMMSGKTYMEAEDTPNFCSPASESHWSM